MGIMGVHHDGHVSHTLAKEKNKNAHFEDLVSGRLLFLPVTLKIH